MGFVQFRSNGFNLRFGKLGYLILYHLLFFSQSEIHAFTPLK